MGITKPNKPTHRASLVLDGGKGTRAIWTELGALWPSKTPGVLSGQIGLAGDLTLKAGQGVSLVISPINRDFNGTPDAGGEGGDAPPF